MPYTVLDGHTIRARVHHAIMLKQLSGFKRALIWAPQGDASPGQDALHGLEAKDPARAADLWQKSSDLGDPESAATRQNVDGLRPVLRRPGTCASTCARRPRPAIPTPCTV